MSTLSRIALAALAVVTTTAHLARADNVAAEARAARAEIKKSFGFVPSFIDNMPDHALPSAWEALGALELNPETALSGKVKQLIAVAVAAQVPCSYCIYADTRSALAEGATDAEIKEAVLMAGVTRHWSTVLNGQGYSYKLFTTEIDRAFAFASSGKKLAAPKSIKTPADALSDVTATFGSVPQFIRKVPPAALVPLWKQMKAVQLSPQTRIPCKVKELIGLAVASQIPCKYCVYSHTRAARLLGATEAEIAEAIGMAATVRFWSTYLNGASVDERSFRRDIDRLNRKR